MPIFKFSTDRCASRACTIHTAVQQNIQYDIYAFITRPLLTSIIITTTTFLQLLLLGVKFKADRLFF